jgi:hypothetical protein
MFKIAIVVFVVLIAFDLCEGQSIIITSQGNVSYMDSSDKNKHAQLANIEKVAFCLSRKEKKKIAVFLNIRIEKDTSYYNLGYDNIYGISIKADIYDWKRADYKNLGVYIGVADSVFNQEKIIALVEYGINHVKRLKQLRRRLIKIKEDRPDSITLSKDEIIAIINDNLLKANEILKECE